jgi:ectoine hydroxylase-related dioxygenase (phytanoyl-CoA dioxygenase family)
VTGVRDLPGVDLSAIDFQAGTLDVERAVRAYHEVGVIIVRGLLRRYMDALLTEIQSAVSLVRSELPSAALLRYGWVTASGGIFTDRAGQGDPMPGYRQLIVVPVNTVNSATMRACFQDPGLHQLLHPVLKNAVHPTGSGHCMYKEALHGNEAGLHQDGLYLGKELGDVVTPFAYVVPTPVERGCIWVVPYSHRLGLLPHEESGTRAGCIPYEVCDFDNAVPLPGDVGDTLFWKETIIHGSKGNCTDTPRPAVVVRFAQRPVVEQATGAPSSAHM